MFVAWSRGSAAWTCPGRHAHEPTRAEHTAEHAFSPPQQPHWQSSLATLFNRLREDFLDRRQPQGTYSRSAGPPCIPTAPLDPSLQVFKVLCETERIIALHSRVQHSTSGIPCRARWKPSLNLKS